MKVDADYLIRELECGHGDDTVKVTSTLSKVWCPECHDLVDVTLRKPDGSIVPTHP